MLTGVQSAASGAAAPARSAASISSEKMTSSAAKNGENVLVIGGVPCANARAIKAMQNSCRKFQLIENIGNTVPGWPGVGRDL